MDETIYPSLLSRAADRQRWSRFEDLAIGALKSQNAADRDAVVESLGTSRKALDRAGAVAALKELSKLSKKLRPSNSELQPRVKKLSALAQSSLHPQKVVNHLAQIVFHLSYVPIRELSTDHVSAGTRIAKARAQLLIRTQVR